MATFYTLDGERYEDNEEGRQSLLEDISSAISTEAWSDPDLKTDEERQEAESMAWDGTNYQMEFWDNIMAVMQQSPYELDVKREEGPDDGQEAPCKHCGYTIIYELLWQKWEHYDSGSTWCYDDNAEAEPKE